VRLGFQYLTVAVAYPNEKVFGDGSPTSTKIDSVRVERVLETFPCYSVEESLLSPLCDQVIVRPCADSGPKIHHDIGKYMEGEVGQWFASQDDRANLGRSSAINQSIFLYS
jgi:hypothetical protein